MRTLIAISLLLGSCGRIPLYAQRSFPPIPASGPGSGTVTNVDGSGSNGVETVQGGSLAAITGSGSVRASSTVDNIIGTTYTIVTGDRGRLKSFCNTDGIAVAVPAADSSSFRTGWFTDILNTCSGAVTLTPVSGTIDGAAQLALTVAQSVRLVSDGTNYYTLRGLAPPAQTPPPTPGFAPNQPLAGCGIQYTSGLSSTVGACTYLINGVQYTSPLTVVTLTAADPSLDRIDVIGVNTSGAVFTRAGTPAASPVQPTTDPATELQLTFVSVPAAATAPANVTTDDIYDEGTEWTLSLTANLANSTNNPYHLTHTIEATAAVLNRNIQLVKPASGTVDLATRNALVFYIRSKAAWPTGASGSTAARFLSLWWESGSTQKGNQIILRDGTFGFNSSITSAYQQISIPTILFGANGIPVTKLRIQVSGPAGSSSLGFYLDWITLQGGLGAPALPTSLMNFRGTWSSSTAYSINNVVVSGGLGYVALLASTNVAVSTAATWAPLANIVNITGNAGTASALDHTPTSCSSGQYVSGMTAAVLLTCGAVTDAQLSTSDITTNNVTTSKHGFTPKLDGTAAHYLGGDGLWTTPAGTGATANQNIRSFGATVGSFESGATALSGSKTFCGTVLFGGTITAVETIGDVSGSITVGISTVAHSSWTGRASTSSIVASAPPSLSSAAVYTDTTLNGWTTAFTANTDVCIAFSSPTTVAGVTVTVKVVAN